MADFADFYSLYPRKKSRGDAEKAWGQALKAGYQADEIMAGLQRNLTDLQRRDPQFVPYPASWLRAQGWADEPDIPKLMQAPRREGDMSDYLMARREQRNARTIDAQYERGSNRGPASYSLEDTSGSRRH